MASPPGGLTLSDDETKSPRGKSEPSRTIGNYALGKVIGRGSFGKVRIGQHIHTQTQVAVKILERDKLTGAGDVERMAREIRVLQLLRHDNICNLYEVIETPSEIFLVMEFASGGELFDHIVAQGSLKEPEARRVFGQIVAAVHYCHSHDVIHRDLKPENLLLDDKRNIKLIDYGFANVVRPGDLMRTFCGSPAYAPPEMILGHSYIGVSVDIWSIGVILFAILAGYLPFDDESVPELYKKVLAGRFKCPKRLSEDAKDLIKRILVPEPADRLSLAEIVAHPWMTDGGRLAPVALTAPQSTAPVLTPDPTLLREATGLGFDPAAVSEALRSGARNPETATYFLLEARRRRDPDAPLLTTVTGTVQSSVGGPTMSMFSPAIQHRPRVSSPLASASPADGDAFAIPDLHSSHGGGPLPPLAEGDGSGRRRRTKSPQLADSGSVSPSTSPRPSSGTGAMDIPMNGRRRAGSGSAGRSPSPSSAPSTPGGAMSAGSGSPAVSTAAAGYGSTLAPLNTRRATASAAQGGRSGAVTGSSAPSHSSAAAAAAAAREGTRSARRALLTDGAGSASSAALTSTGSRDRFNDSAPLMSTPPIAPASAAALARGDQPLNTSAPLIGFVQRERKGSIDVGSLGAAGAAADAAGAASADAGLRTVKGVFSVSTTSSRAAAEILEEVERVLRDAGILFARQAYRFECESPVGTVEREHVRFELEICRIPNISLRGLRLKRLHGDTWAYKRICHALVGQMNL